MIGSIVLVHLLAEKRAVTTGPLGWVAGHDLEYVGYILVLLFVGTWLVAVAVWRFARIRQRWATDPQRPAQG